MDKTINYTEEDIKNILSDFILKNYIFNEQSDRIGDDVSLYEKGIIDSTGILELVDFIEERFEIKIDDEELVPDNLDSIKKITMFILRKIMNAS